MTDLEERLRKVLIEHGMDCRALTHRELNGVIAPCPNSKRERLLRDLLAEIKR